jgi:Amt family ammonium transporter
MHRARKALGLMMLLGLVALFPTNVLAAAPAPANWPGWHLQAAFLGLLASLALVLLAVGATPPEDAVETAAAALSALVTGVLAYVVCGFAFEFGGLALQLDWPGLTGLVAEWAPVDPTLALGWGVVGTRGFFLTGAAATADAYALAMTQVPLVALAVLIPCLALARRVGRAALLLVAAVTGGLLYPLVGNWTWGGGWLSMLGLNLGWGNGFVDLGGSATVHLLGAALAFAGVLMVGRRGRVRRPGKYIELPPAYFPLFVLVAALLAPVGWLGIALANPLVTLDLAPGLVALNLVLAGLGGAAPGLLYSWMATGRIDPQLAARGLVAGLVAGSAGCGFMPPLAAILVGLLAGSLLPLLLYWVEHGLRWHDPNAILVTHGASGILGTLWVALFADGRWGIGWNGVSTPFEQAQQGVAGLLVAPGLLPGVPGQLWAQLAGLGAIAVLAFGLPMVLYGALRGAQAMARLFAPRPRRAAASSRSRRR